MSANAHVRKASARPREKDDFYRTPPAATQALLRVENFGQRIWEPACGDGAIARPAALAYGLAGLLRSLPFHNSRHKLYLPLDLLAALQVTADEFFILKDDPRIAAAVRQTALRARDHFLAGRRGPRPRTAMAAILPAALVPVYLHRLSRMRDVSIHRRQMALLSAAMKKRL